MTFNVNASGNSCIDSLMPGDAIKHQTIWVYIGSGNGLLPDGHYLKQFQLIIQEVLWHSPEVNFTGNTYDFILDMSLKITNWKIQLYLWEANMLRAW